jgi:hypothetical protein
MEKGNSSGTWADVIIITIVLVILAGLARVL